MKAIFNVKKLLGIALATVFVSIFLFLFPSDLKPHKFENPAKKLGPAPPANLADVPIHQDSSADGLIQRLREKKMPEAFLRWVVLSRKSWSECRSAMENENPSKNVASTFSYLVAIVSSEDLSQLPAALEVISDPMERERVVSETFSLCASLSLDHFVREAKLKLDGPMRAKAFNAAIPRLLDADDVNSAIALASQLPPSEFREKIKANIASKWAQTAPEDALGWAMTQLDQAELKSIELGIVRGFAYTMELQRAFTLADMLKTPDAKMSFIGTVAGRLAKQDTESATKWIEMLPTEWKGVAESTYIEALSNSDIPRATEFALASKNEVVRLQGFDAISRNLSKGNLSTSAKWIESIPPEIGVRVIPIFINELVRTDYSDAQRWVNMISKRELRDKGYALAVERLASLNPVEARKVAELIGEPTLRSKTLSALERAK